MTTNSLERRLLRVEQLHKPAVGLEAIFAGFTNLELIDVIMALAQASIDDSTTPQDERRRLVDEMPKQAGERPQAAQWARYDPHPPRPVAWLLQRLISGSEPPGGERVA